MKNKIAIFISIVAVVIVGLIYMSSLKDATGGAYTYQTCNVTTTDAVAIGDDISSTILSATSGRTWARLEILSTERDTLSLMFGATATVGNGLELSSTTATYIDIGFSTDIPYTGIITGITNGTASTTILVSECK